MRGHGSTRQRGCLLWTALWLAVACSSDPSAYQLALGRATEAERGHDATAARKHLNEAVRQATSPSQVDEARYRLARLSLDHGDYRGAAGELREFAKTYPGAERAPRAWLDAGRAWERAGDTEQAKDCYQQLLERHPDSVLALAAATRIVALTDAEPHQTWAALLAQNKSPRLDIGLRYNWARSLEESSPVEALGAFEDIARRDPLPQGAHTDEALLHAAALRRRLGDPRGALATLDALLDARSFSYMAGSYERSAFAEARLLQGQILRDDLRDFPASAAAFERLVVDHPTSRLVDDALFQAAHAHFLEHDAKAACDKLQELREKRADSRYAACDALYCGSAAATVGAACCRLPSGFEAPTACKTENPEAP